MGQLASLNLMMELNIRTFNLYMIRINIENFDKVTHYNTGTALIIEGYVVLTPDNKQPFEVHLETIELVGSADESYPLQKKRHGFEFLREISHLRPRTNTFSAVYRVRSELSFAVHKFFPRQQLHIRPHTNYYW